VTNMYDMFARASHFNSNISNWNVGRVADMRSCSMEMKHNDSTKTSALGVPSYLLPSIMAALLKKCFSTLVAPTGTVLQDVQDHGVKLHALSLS